MSGSFDVDEFLAQPLVARVATAGPVVRPVWYLWEDGSFWVLIGPWSAMGRRLAADPVFEIAVDVCDLRTGLVRQVLGRGEGATQPLDRARARRKLMRYLGPDESGWDPRFSLDGDVAARGLRWARLTPRRLEAKDQSFVPSLAGAAAGAAVPEPEPVLGPVPGAGGEVA